MKKRIVSMLLGADHGMFHGRLRETAGSGSAGASTSKAESTEAQETQAAAPAQNETPAGNRL